jgi:hypothetical protein
MRGAGARRESRGRARLQGGNDMATVQPMPRVLATLLLLCFAWSQAFAADCPLASLAGAAAAPAHTLHAEHAHALEAMHGMVGHTSPPRSSQPEHHRTSQCVLAMACGMAALPTHVGDSAGVRLSTRTVPWPAGAAYLSPVLGSDPPPPRLPA